MRPYRTLLQSAAAEFVVNKSRFIGSGAPAGTEEAALALLSEIRQSHKDANHNCYAYIVGANMGVMRYSDDGEPGGTAGLPIIEHMKSRGITNCLVVVTRYFGGIKLGGGGLVRAYSDAVAQAIEAAGIREVRLCRLLRVDVDYAEAGVVENQLRTLELPSGALLAVTDVEWGAASAHITVGVDERAVAEFEEALQTLSAGSLTARSVGEEWVDR